MIQLFNFINKQTESGVKHTSQFLCSTQGNLKGESIVTVILLSHMEASYCASGFFRS